ncbi:hypothetical protein EV216_1378 [Rhodovulum steppense]|uniref:Uncharacterized protein n=1 Tax=Rhodovulum steppense TaxID=540251 RepID=A0A4R1YHM1_9RHOB|nr:hypothetical protein EV216_1378 [Rhodovulum steppense]
MLLVFANIKSLKAFEFFYSDDDYDRPSMLFDGDRSRASSIDQQAKLMLGISG